MAGHDLQHRPAGWLCGLVTGWLCGLVTGWLCGLAVPGHGRPVPMPNCRRTRAQNASRSHSRASW
jgi:hypothetical protein